MDLRQAMDLLGIEDSNYTEEMLKKAYRQKSKENHPDYHSEKGPEAVRAATHAMQQINIAMELLSSRLKQFSKEEKNVDLSQYKESLIRKIKHVYRNKPSSMYPDYFNEAVHYINGMINSIIPHIKDADSTNAAYEIYINLKNELKKIYEEIINDFCNENKIDAKQYPFNYEVNLQNLYIQLLNAKRLYDSKIKNYMEKFKRNLKRIIDKYSSYKLYNECSILINKMKENAIKEAYNGVEPKEVLSSFDQEVATLLSCYNDCKKMFKKIFDLHPEIFESNNDLGNKASDLYSEFLYIFSIDYLSYKKRISSFLKELSELYKEINNKDKSRDSNQVKDFDDAYKEMVSRYQRRISNKEIFTDSEYYLVNQLFNKALEYCRSVFSGEIDINEAIIIINKVRFEDIRSELSMFDPEDKKHNPII